MGIREGRLVSNDPVIGLQALRRDFARDGFVFIPRAMDAGALAKAEAAYAWSLAHPGPFAGPVLAGVPGAFYQDHANPESYPAYRPLLLDTPLARMIAAILGSESLWLLYEQIWLKEGGATRRTPWHQDLAYVPMAGEHMATAWITLDPVPRADSLELIPGSHRGPLFNPTAFDANDETLAMLAEGIWPPLPDIEAARHQYDIAAWAIEPGDLLLFHSAVLHGGAATAAGARRRTISLRVFGDDVVCDPRPEQGLADVDRLSGDQGDGDPIRELACQPAGTPFRHPAFRSLVQPRQ